MRDSGPLASTAEGGWEACARRERSWPHELGPRLRGSSRAAGAWQTPREWCPAVPVGARRCSQRSPRRRRARNAETSKPQCATLLLCLPLSGGIKQAHALPAGPRAVVLGAVSRAVGNLRQHSHSFERHQQRPSPIGLHHPLLRTHTLLIFDSEGLFLTPPRRATPALGGCHAELSSPASTHGGRHQEMAASRQGALETTRSETNDARCALPWQASRSARGAQASARTRVRRGGAALHAGPRPSPHLAFRSRNLLLAMTQTRGRPVPSARMYHHRHSTPGSARALGRPHAQRFTLRPLGPGARVLEAARSRGGRPGRPAAVALRLAALSLSCRGGGLRSLPDGR